MAPHALGGLVSLPLRNMAPSSSRPIIATNCAAAHVMRRYKSAVHSKGNAMSRTIARNLKASTIRTPDLSMTKAIKEERVRQEKQKSTMFAPGTFVTFPLSSQLKNPRELPRYFLHKLRAWATERASILRVKMQSMPKWTTRPKYQIGMRKVVATGKALHREMLEALAAGDKEALATICRPACAADLSIAISRRRPGEAFSFEILKYNKPLFYPRMSSFLVYTSPYNDDMVCEQAVIGIASTQQVSRINISTGETVPGSQKVQDKLEYLVLVRNVDGKTFQPLEQWQIWGTTLPKTVDEHLEDVASYEEQMSKQFGIGKKA